ncbi:MAG: hypothetical protein ACON35_02690 [Candidatus Marinamargulisbacteria bacterium]
MITRSSAIASAQASVKLRQQEKKEVEPRRSGRKTKPSYAIRVAESTAQFLEDEKKRVLALKEDRALKRKEKASKQKPANPKAPKRKPANLEVFSAQKRVKRDKENKENKGAGSHQSTPNQTPKKTVFGQVFYSPGVQTLADFSAVKLSGRRISREEVTGEFDQSPVQPVSPLGGGLNTPGAGNTQEFDLGFNFDTPHSSLYGIGSSQISDPVRAQRVPLSPLTLEFKI